MKLISVNDLHAQRSVDVLVSSTCSDCCQCLSCSASFSSFFFPKCWVICCQNLDCNYTWCLTELVSLPLLPGWVRAIKKAFQHAGCHSAQVLTTDGDLSLQCQPTACISVSSTCSVDLKAWYEECLVRRSFSQVALMTGDTMRWRTSRKTPKRMFKYEKRKTAVAQKWNEFQRINRRARMVWRQGRDKPKRDQPDGFDGKLQLVRKRNDFESNCFNRGTWFFLWWCFVWYS